MNVFLVVVSLQPTKKQKEEDGAVPVVVVQPTAVIAKDSQQASMKAARLVPPEHADKEDRLDIHVLPFQTAAR